MRQYKASLCILNSQYGDLEKRCLYLFTQNPNLGSISIIKGMNVFSVSSTGNLIVMDSGIKLVRVINLFIVSLMRVNLYSAVG